MCQSSKDQATGNVDMPNDLITILARGLCSFTAGLDRNLDGHTKILAREPKEPCEKICEFCQCEAEHLAALVSRHLEGNINVNE